jgi:PAS domain S-box-containing protein
MNEISGIQLSLIYQVYGLAFFVLGVVVIVLPRVNVALCIMPNLGFLAAFGMLHGILEFVKGIQTTYQDRLLIWLSLILLLCSYVALMEFGRRSWNQVEEKYRLSPVLTYGVILSAFSIYVLFSSDLFVWVNLGARYFIGVPAALITGMALFQAMKLYSKDFVFESWLRSSSISFLLYGLLSLFVTSHEGVPDWLPTTTDFYLLTGFPVQLLRALCAVALAVSFVMLIRHNNKVICKSILHDEVKIRSQAKIIDQIHNSVVSTDLDGYITSWNKGAENIYGYSSKEALGRHIELVYPEERRDFLKNEIITELKKSGSHELEVELVNKSGEVFCSHLSLSMVYDDKNIATGMVGYTMDITQRKKIELQIKKSEELLEKAQNISKIGHWKLILETKEVTGSGELFRILGLKFEPVTLEDFVSLIHPDDSERCVSSIQRGMNHGENWDIEHRIICNDGEEKWVHSVGEAITDNSGHVIELVGTVQDVTRQRNTENEIQKSQARFEAVFESIPDAIFFIDSNRNIKMVNKSSIEMFGYDYVEILDKNIDMIFTSTDNSLPNERKLLHSHLNFIHMPYEIEYKRKNGTIFLGETIATSVTSSNGEELGSLGIIRDVSERAHVEDILRSLASGESGLKYESFINEVLIHLTELYNCEYASIGQLQDDNLWIKTLAVLENGERGDNTTYELKGTACEDAFKKGKNLIPEKVSEKYPEDKILIDMGIESYFGVPLITQNGKSFGVLSIMSRNPICVDEWTESVLGVFARRISLELERDISSKELEQHREHLEDLVTQRTVDLSVARDQAEQANISKSEFLSRMSHELRTPLNAILGFGQLLKLDMDKFDETQNDNVQEILEAGRHLLALINEVLDLSKIESGKLNINIENVSINKILTQCVTLLNSEAEVRNINFIDEFSVNQLMVKADEIRLKQVIINLISNAVKYNRESGSIVLNSKVNEKNIIRISVSDDGEGLTESEINKLFQPFERLNAVNNVEGTGIGLVICKRLIKSMGGNIGVNSIKGKGSTFWIELALFDNKG